MKHRIKIFVLAVIVFLAEILYSISTVSAVNYRNILILNSYDLNFQWTSNIRDGICTVFNDKDNINLYYEFMDMKNRNKQDINYIKMLYCIYDEKYKNTKFDAIICADNDALKFLVTYGEKLFGSTPVVFCGINNFKSSLIKNKNNFTGVVEKIDVKSTIRSIFTTRPDTKNVIVICDTTTTGKINEINTRDYIKGLKSNSKFYFYRDTTTEDVNNGLKKLGKNTVILDIGQLVENKDKEKRFIPFEKNKGILSSMNAPVYVCWNFLLCDGIMGGKLIGGFDQGKVAAQIAFRIAMGEDIKNIPIVEECPSKYIFNYNDLIKYKVDIGKLPKNYNIINKPFSFYEAHKNIIIVGSIIIFMLSIFVVILVINIRKRIIIENNLKRNYEELNCVYEELAQAEEELKAQYDEIQKNSEYLQMSKKRYELAIDGANDVIWEWDMVNRTFFASDKWKDIMGYTVTESKNIDKMLKDLVFREDYNDFIDKFNKHITGKIPYFKIECRINNKCDNKKWIYVRGKIEKDINGQPIKMAGSITDITERKIIENKNIFLARYDRLTGLFNRTSFLDILKEEIINNKLKGNTGALLFLDIDNFKNVNDTLGHDYGDMLLKLIAKRMLDILNKGEIICRLGGDEFLVLLSRIDDVDDAKKVAENILEVFQKSFNVNERKIFTTASIGISIFPNDGINVNVLLKNADTAMYKAKERGKNKYLFYDKNMFYTVMRKTNLENGLRYAIEKNELRLLYQPQVNICSGKIQGVEVLLRWNSNEYGEISPNEFIPIAEKTERIILIGRWVLKNACLKNKELIDKGLTPLVIAVNISVVQLQYSGFLKDLKDILEETGLDPKYLELEITESVMMKYMKHNLDILNKIKRLGVNIALDDFGTGYSSLSYLRVLPINKLKLDKSFIDEVYINENDKSIADGIIQLAHKIGLKVIAEGVELKEQFNLLKRINCDEIQGYYFSRPISEEEFEKIYINR